MHMVFKTCIVILLLMGILLTLGLGLFIPGPTGGTLAGRLLPAIWAEPSAGTYLGTDSQGAWTPSTSRIILIMLHIMLSCTLAAIITIRFRKTTAPEYLFLVIALLAFGLSGVRLAGSLLAPFGVSGLGNEIIFRLFYLFWALGASLLFFSGMFSNGIAFLKQNIFFIISCFAAISLALIVPMDLFAGGTEDRLIALVPDLFLIIIRATEVLTVLNLVAASMRNNSAQYLLVAAALLLLCGGNELMIVTEIALPLRIAGLVSYGAGAVWYVYQTNRIRLWT